MRAVIVGNSGSGKTWFAKRLAEASSSRVVHLDEIFWLPGGFNTKRDARDVSRLIESEMANAAWIAEGVYGDLAKQFMPNADTFIWLELPLSVCLQRLKRRGSESRAHMGREQSEAGLLELVSWAEDYASRQGSSGRAAHLELFESFKGQRLRFGSESEVLEFLNAP
jgi:adenylate kinase family enzyme